MMILDHPEYVHVLLNPIPAYVLGTGLAVLALALARKSREMELAALLILMFVGIMALPTWYYGHLAFDHLEPSLTAEAKRWTNVHAQRADRLVYSLYMTGIVALGAIAATRWSPASSRVLAVAALLCGTAALAAVLFISRPGGEIRHSELRSGSPPDAPTHHHEH
jgi:hypothetical protein